MAAAMPAFERVEAAHRMEVTDRVPVAPIVCSMIPYLAGMTIREMLHEPEKLVGAFIEASSMLNPREREQRE